MLKRGIKRWDLVLLFINSMIGAGIYGLPSKVFALAGVYSLLAFVICAAVILVIILCFAEVSSRFKSTGGPYIYILHAFGRLPAFGMGWLLLLSRIFNYGTLINLIVIYLSFFSPVFEYPVVKLATILLLTAFLTVTNVAGVEKSVRLNNVLTVGKLLPLLAFIVVGLLALDPQRLQPTNQLQLESFSRSVMLLIFAFGGFESNLVNTGEMADPRKDIPFALFSAIATVAAFYCLIQLVCIGNLPGLASSEKPVADAASVFMGSGGGRLMAAGAFISIFGALNAVMLSGSRLPFALSEEGQFPRFFSAVHKKYRTPHWSVIFFTGVVVIISLSGSFIQLLSIGTIIRLLVYLFVCASLIPLRRKDGTVTGYFRIRGGRLLAVAAMIICLVLLASATITEVLQVIYALAAGGVIYFLHRITASKNFDSK